jgi:hypothetical protein
MMANLIERSYCQDLSVFLQQKNRRLSQVPVFYLLSPLPQPEDQGSGLFPSKA